MAVCLYSELFIGVGLYCIQARIQDFLKGGGDGHKGGGVIGGDRPCWRKITI